MVKSNLSGLEVLLCCTVILSVVLVQFAKADDLEDTKVKRASGNMGLFPFPRVGRSDPDLTNWDSVLNSLEDYNELYRSEAKRQGLIPFPRVGRSGYKAPQGPQVNGGMWFGPRLGRIQKRSSDKGHNVYTPRLGRELEEQQLAGDEEDFRDLKDGYVNFLPNNYYPRFYN